MSKRLTRIQISAFDIWKLLKELPSSDGPVQNADMAWN